MTVEYLADRREFIPTVGRWHYTEWDHLRPGETVEDRAVRVERDCGHCEIPTTFVALAGHQCLGSASLVACDMDIRPTLTPWLSGVFVAPAHRGIGAALVERVVQEAQALGKPCLYLYTPGSGALYLRLGWWVAERTFYRELWGEQEVTIMEFAIHVP